MDEGEWQDKVAEKLRKERNFVSQLYPGLPWQAKVANMPTEKVTALYIKYKDDPPKIRKRTSATNPIATQPITVKRPENPDQGRLF